MSLRQCIHRGTGEGVQLCTIRAPRVLSNAPRARRARFIIILRIHKQWKHGTMHVCPDLLHIHLLCPEHYEHYARSDVA